MSKRNKVLLVMSALMSLAGILMLIQVSTGRPFRSSQQIKTTAIQAAEGRAYATSASPFRQVLENGAFVRITENGRFLWPATSSEQVKTGLKGQFAISAKQIWFSTWDESDPRLNGRTYSVSYARPLGVWHKTTGWVLFAGGFALLLTVLLASFESKVSVQQAQLQSIHYWKKPGYEWGLDVMRGVAISVILVTHLPITFPAQVSQQLHSIAHTIQLGGWVGVDLFFVMSGYLVSGLLFREYQQTGGVEVGRFLIRRGLKIYPAHWFMIFATILVASYTGAPDVSADKIIGELFYLQNLLSGNTLGSSSLWDHTWSLAVEEHFYLLMAFAFAVSFSSGNRNLPGRLKFLPWMALLVCSTCLVIRLARLLFVSDPSVYNSNYYMSYTRMDALMAGVFIRYCRYVNKERLDWYCRKLKWVGVPLCVCALLPVFVYNEPRYTLSIGLTINYLGASALLMSLIAWQSSPFPSWIRPLAFVGRYSYSIYLWHMAVYLWLGNVLSRELTSVSAWLFSLAVHLLGAVAVGLVTSMIVESPTLKLRDRMFPSRS
jgi:peptidoglycan/LPS O-acetylase OafA/YrhL